MGLKLSCIHRGNLSRQVSLPAPVRVIASDGSLKEFPARSIVAVSDVLGLGGDAAALPFFVCNSDALYFNESPPALAPGEMLRPGQIYFVLPAAMLGRPLSSAEMAELAVRASAAIASSIKARRRGQRHGRSGGKKKVRVMPFGLSLKPARSDKKVTAAAAARSRLRRALSIIREDAE
ncbi:hypothetical protein EJB05_24667, partial [Eragrostis curvula]